MTDNMPKKEISYDMKFLIVILTLIFVYPIGVVLMFKWMSWRTWIKILIVLPIGLVFIALASSILLAGVNPRLQVQRANCKTECESAVNQTVCIQDCLDNLAEQQTAD